MPLMGVMPGLKCFIAAVLGGIGNTTGAVLGGFILGMAEIMLITFLPAFTGYRDAMAFVILIVVLLVKPTGLLGEKVRDKAVSYTHLDVYKRQVYIVRKIFLQ